MQSQTHAGTADASWPAPVFRWGRSIHPPAPRSFVELRALTDPKPPRSRDGHPATACPVLLGPFPPRPTGPALSVQKPATRFPSASATRRVPARPSSSYSARVALCTTLSNNARSRFSAVTGAPFRTPDRDRLSEGPRLRLSSPYTARRGQYQKILTHEMSRGRPVNVRA
ncbi:hypothetical protein FKP32DRAFT_1228461 [Trametes sanguinea]|nr:hypothetical protein FKP32DRAFT_1228461 [Trametes sanguinea]